MVPFEFSVGHTVPVNLLAAVTRIISYLSNSNSTIQDITDPTFLERVSLLT